jgi:hypothetical protein
VNFTAIKTPIKISQYLKYLNQFLNFSNNLQIVVINIPEAAKITRDCIIISVSGILSGLILVNVIVDIISFDCQCDAIIFLFKENIEIEMLNGMGINCE